MIIVADTMNARIEINTINEWEALTWWGTVALPVFAVPLLAVQGPVAAICYVVAVLLLGSLLGRVTDRIDDLVVIQCHRETAPGVSVAGALLMMLGVLARVALPILLAAWWAQ